MTRTSLQTGRISFLLAIFFATLPARAELDSRTVRVGLTDQVRVSQAAPLTTSVARQTQDQIGVSFSGWMPTQLSLPMAGAATQAFERMTPGQVRLEWTSPFPLRALADRGLRWQLKVGYSALTRRAEVPFTGMPRAERQNLHLIPLHLGLEAAPRILSWRWVSFRASASAARVVLALQPSAFDAGGVSSAWMGELAAGADLPLGDWRLGFEAMSTLPMTRSRDLGATGFRVGLRYGI